MPPLISRKKSRKAAVQQSDDYSEFFACAPCIEKGKKTEAVNYCDKCESCFCSVCIASHLTIFPEHPVFTKLEHNKWRNKHTTQFIENCAVHPDQMLEMYCCNHDTICCSVCVSTKHRSCEGLNHIVQAAYEIRSKKEFKEIKTAGESVFRKLTKLKDSRSQYHIVLEKYRNDLLSSIREFRDKINLNIDILEECTLQELQEIFAKQTADTTLCEEACDTFKEEIKKTNNQFKDEDETESRIFIKMKRYQEKIAEAEKLIIENQTKRWHIKFIPDTKLDEYLSLQKYLGRFEEKTKCSKTGVTISNKRHVYQVKQKNEYNVRISKDTSDCCIWGCCSLPDGSILLADGNNKRLKRLNDHFKVSDYCELPAKPNDVCNINSKEIAVALWNNTIQFVNVRGKMELTKSLKLYHCCRSLAYQNNHLYVLDNIIYIYSDSKQIKSLYRDYARDAKLQYIAVSEDGNRIYITDWERGLITLDNDGRKLATFTDKELTGAIGVCIDGGDNIFVAGGESNTIVQVDSSGHNKIGAHISCKDGVDHALSLISDGDGISQPKSLCYCSQKSLLIVGRYSDEISVLELM